MSQPNNGVTNKKRKGLLSYFSKEIKHIFQTMGNGFSSLDTRNGTALLLKKNKKNYQY